MAKARHRNPAYIDGHRLAERSQTELAFADLIADTERLGLYEIDPAEVKAARKKTEG